MPPNSLRNQRMIGYPLRIPSILVALTLLAIFILPIHSQSNGVSPSAPTSGSRSKSISNTPSKNQLVTPEIRQAIQRGRTFLKKRQRENGQIGSKYPVAETSLATLALLAGGNTPTRGPYQKTVRKGFEYVLSQARGRNTFLTGPSGQSRMHGHGFAILLLAEVYGSYELSTNINPDEVRKTIKSAIRTTRYAQTKLGGWGYKPVPHNGDEASVTITQIQALRAARNAGIQVDPSTIDRAIEYIKKSHAGNGRFMYSLSQNRNRFTYALTASAISTLNYTGVYQNNTGSRSPELSQMIEKGLEYMRENEPAPENRFYFYGLFYAAQAHYFSGQTSWRKWYRKFANDLVELQKEEGHWKSNITHVYSTALSLLILQIPYNFLPIFQK